MNGGITGMRPTRYEGPRLPPRVQWKRLRSAMEYELTEKQRRVLEDYYLRGKRISEIARENGLNKSTVSRHLARAVEKLQRVLRY